VLAEFGSVVDAVRCAIDIQAKVATANTGLPDNLRMSRIAPSTTADHTASSAASRHAMPQAISMGRSSA
jgi:hypothetical protein